MFSECLPRSALVAQMTKVRACEKDGRFCDEGLTLVSKASVFELVGAFILATFEADDDVLVCFA